MTLGELPSVGDIAVSWLDLRHYLSPGWNSKSGGPWCGNIQTYSKMLLQEGHIYNQS